MNSFETLRKHLLYSTHLKLIVKNIFKEKKENPKLIMKTKRKENNFYLIELVRNNHRFAELLRKEQS